MFSDMETFQIVGDLHFYLGSKRPFQPSMLQPLAGANYLLVTGDITQAYTKEAFSFYGHCAKNWKKTFIVMGNQEYESAGYNYPFHMDYSEAYMRHLIQIINADYGEERLFFIQHNFVELPELRLRIAGLTLWANGTILATLRKTVQIPNKTYSLKMEGDMCSLTLNMNLKHFKSYTLTTDEFSFHERGHPSGVQNPFDNHGSVSVSKINQEDLLKLQEKDTVFIERMIADCEQNGYRLIMVSHFIPTLDVLPETQAINSYIDQFPYEDFCRDMTKYLKKPICAWICGHIHEKQTSGIVHINCSEVQVPI
jgi:hypothetical protein